MLQLFHLSLSSLLGGIIEACPPSDSVTALTVDMLIEPNGTIGLVSAGDQIHADSQFSCWGMSVPQSSVEPEELNDACHRVAESCKSRGVSWILFHRLCDIYSSEKCKYCARI